MYNPMNAEIEHAMRRAFDAWMRLRDAAIHNDNEAEQERLVDQAEHLADGWEASQYAEEWTYLVHLLDGWKRSPQTMREVTTAAQRGKHASLTGEEIRSLTQASLLMDPDWTGPQGWQAMHDQISRMHGLSAAGHDIGDLQARLSIIFDRQVWPAEWIGYEIDAQNDAAFWARQTEMFDEAQAAADVMAGAGR